MKQKFTGTNLPTPFQGEMMTCYVCGKKKRSDPKVESDWTAITTDDSLRLYFCPKCFKAFLKTQR